MPHTIAKPLVRLPFALLLLAAACSGVRAQEAAREKEEPISADRPDFVESSEVVGKGRVQLETSFLTERERNDEERERSYSMPTLLRIGLSRALELRIESEGRTVQHTTDKTSGERSTTAGYADSAVGLLWHAADADGMRPSVGVLVDAEFPTGSGRLRGEGARPSLRVVGEWELPGEMQLGVMPGIAVEHTEEAGRYTHGIFAVALEKGFNERLHGYAQVAMPQIAGSRHGGIQASAGIGASWLISNDCQLDTMFSRGLNHRTPYASWTVGLSFRL
ncbi:MAG: transporter [Telluria sp.]